MKVYCCNCKYRFKLPNHNNVILCSERYSNRATVEGFLPVEIWSTFARNNDETCKHYKRKWWKFWIK